MVQDLPLSFQEKLFEGSSAILTTESTHQLLCKVARHDKAAIRSLRHEINLLTKLKHPHIIRLLEFNNQEENLPWFTMDLAKANLRLALREELNRSSVSSEEKLQHTMSLLAQWLYEISDALVYLHENKILHLDIRPENIVIFHDNRSCLIDFGGAVCWETKEEQVVSQLTPWYSHPKLTNKIFSPREWLTLPTRELSPLLDIFSLGRTILALLAMVDREFPDIISYNYYFLYLHLMACRMLDGKNLSLEETNSLQQAAIQKGQLSDVYRETWLNFKPTDFQTISYRSAVAIKEDLEKLLYPNRLYEVVPEINPALNKRIHIGEAASAPATERVLLILTHPVFERLKQVPQLEMMDTIYPSANHTRFEHSIGVLRNAALYINALYFDRYNPLFRQLGNPTLYKAILLAALLHDLGQFPFAHTLEEAFPQLRHERFSLAFLDHKTTDRANRTLQDIVESPEFGWGVPLSFVKQLLDIDQKENNLFAQLPPALSMSLGILDGPIDCDKLDYLQRDSHKCYLPYGLGIDEQRLISSLTIIARRDEKDQLKLILGCYEKGQSAAESLSFARYLLYRSLYWHHSSRALRSMLVAAARTMAPHQKLIPKLKRELMALLGLTSQKVRPIGVEEVLDLIETKASQAGKELIRQLRARQYYKNILTFSANHPTIEIKRFRQACQTPTFQAKLQQCIAEKFQLYLNNNTAVGCSLLRPEKIDKTLELLNRPLMVLCDAPLLGSGAKENLYFIPEPDRLKKNYLSRSLSASRISDVWSGIHQQLMFFAARGMIFCHPEIRNSLMAALGPEGIEQAILETLSRGDF